MPVGPTIKAFAPRRAAVRSAAGMILLVIVNPLAGIVLARFLFAQEFQKSLLCFDEVVEDCGARAFAWRST